MKSFLTLGKGRSPSVTTGKVRPDGFGKIILAGGSGIFPENLACGGGLHEGPRNRE